eukprot:Rmarinus@m.25386
MRLQTILIAGIVIFLFLLIASELAVFGSLESPSAPAGLSLRSNWLFSEPELDYSKLQWEFVQIARVVGASIPMAMPYDTATIDLFKATWRAVIDPRQLGTVCQLGFNPYATLVWLHNQRRAHVHIISGFDEGSPVYQLLDGLYPGRVMMHTGAPEAAIHCDIVHFHWQLHDLSSAPDTDAAGLALASSLPLLPGLTSPRGVGFLSNVVLIDVGLPAAEESALDTARSAVKEILESASFRSLSDGIQGIHRVFHVLHSIHPLQLFLSNNDGDVGLGSLSRDPDLMSGPKAYVCVVADFSPSTVEGPELAVEPLRPVQLPSPPAAGLRGRDAGVLGVEGGIDPLAENARWGDNGLAGGVSKGAGGRFTRVEKDRVIVITPTYERATRRADMTRLANTLYLVNQEIVDVYWIVVEDSEDIDVHVQTFLEETMVPFNYMSTVFDNGPHPYKHKGLDQRNTALDFIRAHRVEGVVYFADDDNSYDPRLFLRMLRTKAVSVFPVGLSGLAAYESPLIENDVIVGWHSGWQAKRTYAIDMAGFAFRAETVLFDHPEVRFQWDSWDGYMETDFLKTIGISRDDVEFLGWDVYVWHVRTSYYGKIAGYPHSWVAQNVPAGKKKKIEEWE